jgi:hypothetical protein
MGTQIAGCGDHQSGQRFPDSSDPRLIRHIASCDMAGGDSISPSAGKDQKLSWGFGGEAPDDRGLSACISSLDPLKNNQHTGKVPDYYRRPVGRGKFCGRCCCRGVDPKTGRKVYRRINCGSWSCSYCGPRRAITARRAIRDVAERLDLRFFLTLTLDPKKLEHPKFAVQHLRDCFNKFREYLKRKFGEAPSYICVLEFTEKGVPHLHILFDRYIQQQWISEVWDSLGGGRIVFIKRVTIRKVTRYLSKYLTKELLLSAPKGTRRITTARSIKLFPKFKSGIVWELLRTSIWQELRDAKMRDWSRQRVLGQEIALDYDEETILKAFWMIDAWRDKPQKEGEVSLCELLTV